MSEMDDLGAIILDDEQFKRTVLQRQEKIDGKIDLLTLTIENYTKNNDERMKRVEDCTHDLRISVNGNGDIKKGLKYQTIELSNKITDLSNKITNTNKDVKAKWVMIISVAGFFGYNFLELAKAYIKATYFK